MDSDTEALFLAAAYKFLSEISLGGGPSIPAQKFETAKSGNEHHHPHPPRAVKVRPCISGKDWLQDSTTTLSSSFTPIVATLALSTSLNGSCRLAIKGYVPLPHRRLAKSDEQRGARLDIPKLHVNTGKAQSYRHLLPKRLRRFGGWGRHEESSDPDSEGSSSTSTSSYSSSVSLSSSTSELSSSSSHHSSSHPSSSSSSGGGDTDHEADSLLDGEEYQSDILDDPQLRTGKHRTIITLTSFLASIDHFTKAEFLKRELNEKFRNLHPEVHPTLTLSQIRSLKTRILGISMGEGLEAVTVARSFVYLEKLIMKKMVWKGNRKAVAGCCLLLAAKATDSKKTDHAHLVGRLASELPVDRKELTDLEFPILAALHFRLQIPEAQFGGHLSRILSYLDYSNLQEYLGERMHDSWQQTL